MIDKNGQQVNIGDSVTFNHYGTKSVGTVEEIAAYSYPAGNCTFAEHAVVHIDGDTVRLYTKDLVVQGK